MTVPVIQESTDHNRKMALIGGSEKYWGQVPEPTHRLQVEAFEEGVFAVIQFSGKRSSTKETSMKEKLDQVGNSCRGKRLYKTVCLYGGVLQRSVHATTLQKRNEFWARVDTRWKE